VLARIVYAMSTFGSSPHSQDWIGMTHGPAQLEKEEAATWIVGNASVETVGRGKGLC
jgi:hypothetical protein